MSFTLFPRLPPELRRQVFHEYLELLDPGAVYIYNKNLVLLFLDPDGEDERYAGISHQPSVQVALPPLYHVSCEARATFLQWAHLRDMTLRYRKDTKCHILARPWDPARDALYIGRDKWEEFCELPWENEGLEEMAASIRHMALPAFTAYYSFNEVGAFLMHLLTSLETLSSVWGPLPDLRYSTTKQIPGRGWRRRRRLRHLHLAGLVDGDAGDDGEEEEEEDGTDTGVDPTTGDREERIAAEVQPAWELVPETAEMVRMCIRDPLDGSESWETGELSMWMDEVEEALLTVELPEHVYDVEDERFTIEFRAVKAECVKGAELWR